MTKNCMRRKHVAATYRFGRWVSILTIWVVFLVTTATAWTLSSKNRRSRALRYHSSALQSSLQEEGVKITGVTLKIAVDANGAAADLSETRSERFTCGESLDMVHRLRCVSDAVLVGRGTVVADDPSLTVRRVPCPAAKDLIRVILDPRLSLIEEDDIYYSEYKVLTDGLPTVIYHCVPDADDSLLDLPESVTCVYLPASKDVDDPTGSDSIPIKSIIENLSKRFGVKHLMVEGGPATAQLFLRAQMIDRVILVKAPLCFRKPLPSGISDSALQEAGLELLGKAPSGSDEIEYWSRPNLPWPTEKLSDWP